MEPGELLRGCEGCSSFSQRGACLAGWWRTEVRDFHPMCAFPFALFSSVSPKEWPMLSLKPSFYRAQQRQLCRDGSSFLTLQSSLFCHLTLEDNLSCHSCLASLPWPLWAIKKASFTHPHPDEYVLCVPTNLLTVLVIQSLTLFDKQMPGGLIKHVYRNIALCLKLDLPA